MNLENTIVSYKGGNSVSNTVAKIMRKYYSKNYVFK